MKTLRIAPPHGAYDESVRYVYEEELLRNIVHMRYNESPEPCGPLPEGFESKIMHASFRVGDAELMASDGNSTSPAKFDGFSLSLRFKTAEQAERAFNALADGGQVHVPLMTTFFSPKFGMLADRFGAPWMVLVEQAMQG